MNRLELGRYWVERLCTAMPDAPQRVCIRMGWHLAALAIHDDHDLFGLPDAQGRRAVHRPLAEELCRQQALFEPAGAAALRQIAHRRSAHASPFVSMD